MDQKELMAAGALADHCHRLRQGIGPRAYFLRSLPTSNSCPGRGLDLPRRVDRRSVEEAHPAWAETRAGQFLPHRPILQGHRVRPTLLGSLVSFPAWVRLTQEWWALLELQKLARPV